MANSYRLIVILRKAENYKIKYKTVYNVDIEHRKTLLSLIKYHTQLNVSTNMECNQIKKNTSNVITI